MSNKKKNSNYPDFSKLKDIDFQGSFWDKQEFDTINVTLIQTTIKLREINYEIIEYEKKKNQVELLYKRKLRKSILELEKDKTIANATQRKLLAELECEELETKLVLYNSILKELLTLANVFRNELDTLKTISHNLRQEMRL